MRVLAITQIWPNSLEPLGSPFNRQQFRELSKTCEVSVISAIATFPGAKYLGAERTAMLARLPPRDLVDGIETFNMRQLYVPKIGVPVAVPLYLASLAPYAKMARSFDVILGTWAYPDGCAAVIFARALGKPCVVKVHGTDMNVIAKMRSARAIVKRVLPRADALVAVSRALGDELASVGVAREKIAVVPNGVDASIFSPREKSAAREALGVAHDRKVILFVGRLEPQKGVVELLAAFATVRARLPNATLVLLGEGESRALVDAAMARFGDSVRAPGALPLARVATWMTACDVFTLPSWREGTPNVVLEALASGRPVVGSDVGGIPDALRDPRTGFVVPARDADALGRALGDALERAWDPNEVAACGPVSWAESASQLREVLARTLA